MAGEFRWTEEKVDDLISLFEEKPCLFKTKLKEYFNRGKKKKALEDIATALGVTGELRFYSQWCIVASLSVLVAVYMKKSYIR